MKPQPATKINILTEKDYIIGIFDEEQQLIPISSEAFKFFTLSFDKGKITLSVLVRDLESPVPIQELQKAKYLSMMFRNELSVEHKYEILDVVGSTQGNLSSDNNLNYTILFTLI